MSVRCDTEDPVPFPVRSAWGTAWQCPHAGFWNGCTASSAWCGLAICANSAFLLPMRVTVSRFPMKQMPSVCPWSAKSSEKLRSTSMVFSGRCWDSSKISTVPSLSFCRIAYHRASLERSMGAPMRSAINRSRDLMLVRQGFSVISTLLFGCSATKCCAALVFPMPASPAAMARPP